MKQINYAKMSEIKVAKRKWPDAKLTATPLWCAVDLRDGNQALPNPMTPHQKKEYFKLLCDIGFKEIEVGFPAASEDDFNFCRMLINEGLIPVDVTISVLTQARPHLITRTIEALKGAKRSVVHLYIATSELHMRYVFGLDNAQVIKNTVEAVNQIKQESADVLKGSHVGLEFSPEEFTDTDPDFALDICAKVVEAWDPKNGEKVILNLPMTVERRLPNQYADMIEEFMRQFKYGDRAVISLHAHNDMGCAVAASTLALMAGAQRVEGTLLGHGERTGNLDLITLALNLEYLGIDTGLDFHDLPRIVSTVEEITSIAVHPRHPYCGELVFTAFSGSHQDAINKGFTQRDDLAEHYHGWKIPYLHVDPTSLGRSFEKFIRINSQSGKGGIAFILLNDYNAKLPKWAQVDFAKYVQAFADKTARELSSAEVWKIFRETYIENYAPVKLVNYWPRPTDSDPSMIDGELHVEYFGKEIRIKAQGNGPISTLVNALKTIDGIPQFALVDYEEETMGKSADAEGICFVSLKTETRGVVIGSGIDPNIIQSAAKAIISALNRLINS